MPLKGHTLSKEARHKISLSRKGKPILSLIGVPRTEAVKSIISKKLKERFKDKRNHPNFGKKLSEETKKKISLTHRGKVLSLEHIRKVAEMGRKFWSNPENQKKYAYRGNGDKNPNWKGGITSLNQRIRHCLPYNQWRKSIIKRDCGKCQICGIKNVPMDVDHIIALSLIVFKNKIRTIEEALNCKEIWDIENGRLLCIPCHSKTEIFFTPRKI